MHPLHWQLKSAVLDDLVKPVPLLEECKSALFGGIRGEMSIRNSSPGPLSLSSPLHR